LTLILDIESLKGEENRDICRRQIAHGVLERITGSAGWSASWVVGSSSSARFGPALYAKVHFFKLVCQIVTAFESLILIET
jgi:hypothetical protein